MKTVRSEIIFLMQKWFGTSKTNYINLINHANRIRHFSVTFINAIRPCPFT